MKHIVALALGLGLATPALAHKAKANHAHCVKDGTAVEAKGKTDAARKKACADAGGTWDEAKTLKVGEKADAAGATAADAGKKSPTAAKPETQTTAPAATDAGSAPAAGGTAEEPATKTP